MIAQPEPLAIPHPTRRALRRIASAPEFGLAATMVGTVGIVGMVLISLRVATAAATYHRFLVPSAHAGLPNWMAGVFRGLGSPLGIPRLNALLVAMAGLYVLVLVCSRWLPAWIAIAGVVVLTLVWALAPPLFSTDIFNYVAYARMGVLYHVNPYAYGAAAITGDPSVPLTGHVWLHTPSAYGPLFTLLSYAFAPLGVGGAMWAFKAVAALSALGCSALIWMCARRLGIRPLPAMLFFALNPLLLMYAVGGGHNDVLMAVPLLAGALLILDGRPELGGAALVAAIGIKATAGIVLPFVLVASSARWRVLLGAAVSAVVVAILGYAAFGSHVTSMVNILQHHDQLAKKFSSVPGYLDYVFGGGGLTPARYHVVKIVFEVGAVALLGVAWWKRNWLAAGAATLLLLIATLGWLLPWYVVWVLPLAPLARRRWLPVAVMALTGLVVAIQVHNYDVHREHVLRAHGALGVPGPRDLGNRG